MIVKTFDQGWGQTWGWKQFEQQVIGVMLRSVVEDTSQSVIINSVWYTDQYHQEVLHWLRNHQWNQIILVAMLDAAIPQPTWFHEFNRPILCVGSYPGPNELDLCAMYVDQYTEIDCYGDLLDHTKIDRSYMCLNRKPHEHRIRLYQQLQQVNILDHGLVSMGSLTGHALRRLDQDCDTDPVAPNSDIQHYGLPNNVQGLGHPSNWSRHFLNIVTETFFDINAVYFVSEKIYKPLVGQRPFLVYAPDGATTWLHQRGFESYVDDFYDICDLDLRCPDNLVPFLVTLCRQSPAYIRDKFVALTPKILYNQNWFKQYVQQQYQRSQQGIVCPI